MQSGISPRVLVLADGGYRSAFITGLAVKECGHENVKMLYIGDIGEAENSPPLMAVRALSDHHQIGYVAVYHASMGGMFNLTSQIFMALSYAAQNKFSHVHYCVSRIVGDKTLFDYERTHTHLRNMQLMIKSARFENKHAKLPEPEAPAMLLYPYQIVMLSKTYDVPLNLTWNCQGSGPEPCGFCTQCLDWKSANGGRA